LLAPLQKELVHLKVQIQTGFYELWHGIVFANILGFLPKENSMARSNRSLFSYIVSLTIIGLPIFSLGAKPKLTKHKSLSKIICTEYTTTDEGESVDIAKVTVDLNSDDTVKNLKVKRIKFGDEPAIDLVFTPANSERLVHQVELNDIEEIDEETKAPIYKWGIKNIEVITATRKDGKKIRIKINDHLYVGHPGTSITFVVTPGKRFEASAGSDGGVTCEGPLKFPGDSELEEGSL
jgi:hypothetical protein